LTHLTVFSIYDFSERTRQGNVKVHALKLSALIKPPSPFLFYKNMIKKIEPPVKKEGVGWWRCKECGDKALLQEWIKLNKIEIDYVLCRECLEKALQIAEKKKDFADIQFSLERLAFNVRHHCIDMTPYPWCSPYIYGKWWDSNFWSVDYRDRIYREHRRRLANGTRSSVS